MNETFNWDHSGLDFSHFHSLTNLLSLRNGGQAEASSLSDAVLDEGCSSDEDGDEGTPSENTVRAHRIADFGHEKLKRKFLDCLAEFAANKKGGTAVACSAMKEAEGNVVIWVARNEGFSEADKPVFEKLGMMLGLLACGRVDQTETSLWEEMLSYHQSRVESNYIPDLRASLKAYEASLKRPHASTTAHGSILDAKLLGLRGLLFDADIRDTITIKWHAQLIIASYDLRRSSTIEQTLNSSPSATSRSRNLWVSICLLSRIRVAFKNFKQIACTLPSFENVSIILIPRPPAPTSPTQRPLDLKQTFSILGLTTTSDTVQAVMNQKWTLTKTEHEFRKRQRMKLNIHAEVQMIIFLNTSGSSASRLFSYIGCSKLCCFLCSSFIDSYGRFTARGCHGRLFRPWTVPIVDKLLPGQAGRISKALLSVQKEVKNKLVAAVKGNVRMERTSVLGGSSIFGVQREEGSDRQSRIYQWRMKAERDRVAETFRRRLESAASPVRHFPSTTEDSEYEPECDVCSSPTKRRCSACGKDRFCSNSCEDKAFVRHLFTCSKRPLTSADYLWKSLVDDLIPEDEDVLQDFGFNNVIIDKDRTQLFGLYRGLYLSGDISPKDVHEWRVQGIMVDKIKKFYYSYPEHARGQYFPWWLKNLHRLETPTTKEEVEQTLAATFYDEAKSYLDPEDRNKHPAELKPDAKRDSFGMLAHILHRFTPNPTTTLYHSFAFTTCRNRAEESQLLDIYQLLLIPSDGSFFYTFHNGRRSPTHLATFTTFWQSYESGTILQLIDSHGLKNLRSQLPHLEAFLSVPPSGPRPSVWDLKQFLEIGDPASYPPISAVGCDYGFFNCVNFEDTCMLVEIYGRVLERVDLMELHKACIGGRLFEFVGQFIEVEERWRRLLWNPYPLEGVVEVEGLVEEVEEVIDIKRGGGGGGGESGRDGCSGGL
ncbi:hypothetical protein BCR34DRAFT_593143 [Clohesyomyces aquaticus]|uniref:MYND-type domain-containing protein n=1 Tax=Clohesyomyces aquaticus TaxID=1231657 RepID=A0A1Y1YLP7_9PLEO|nr:hypothetical protein BCR34DRAFT_593143 [Clohesyomyces aquaticus]